MIISKKLKLSDIPETMWLPPEVRATLIDGSRHEPTANIVDQVIGSLSALSDRIMHAESHLSKLDMESRLRRLELVLHPFEPPPEHGLPVIPPSYVLQRRTGA